MSWMTGYLGLARETTFAKAATPTTFIPFRRSELGYIPGQNDFLTRGAFYPPPLAAPFKGALAGSVDAQPNTIGHLLTNLLGTPVTTNVAAGVYQHVFEFRRDRPSFTYEASTEEFTARVTGGVLDNVIIGIKTGGRLYASMEGAGRKVEITPRLSPAYDAEEPPVWTDCTVTISGVAPTNMTEINFAMVVPSAPMDNYSSTQLVCGFMQSGPCRTGISATLAEPTSMWFSLLGREVDTSIKLVATGSLLDPTSYQVIISCPKVRIKLLPLQITAGNRAGATIQGVAHPAVGAVNGVKVTLVNAQPTY